MPLKGVQYGLINQSINLTSAAAAQILGSSSSRRRTIGGGGGGGGGGLPYAREWVKVRGWVESVLDPVAVVRRI